MLDRFVAAEGDPEVVMFSGGEPTIHPEIFDFIALAQERGIRQVFLNTNGIRLARDPRFVRALAALKPHVYLQGPPERAQPRRRRLRGDHVLSALRP